jgi:hypothetical protein
LKKKKIKIKRSNIMPTFGNILNIGMNWVYTFSTEYAKDFDYSHFPLLIIAIYVIFLIAVFNCLRSHIQMAVFLQNKLNDIEEIMTSGEYNDRDYLAYDGEEWTMNLLREKAIQLELPDVHWGSRVTLGYVIRIVEQLTKIGDIIEPVYPDGYETDEIDR